MRGKLRDKRDVKRDRLKRELIGRRPVKRDNRNQHLLQQVDENEEDYPVDEDGSLVSEEER